MDAIKTSEPLRSEPRGQASVPAGLSLCVITFNESHNIEACIRSAPFAHEVVVLDSGSTDDTVARAQALGARAYVEPFRGFGPQKNRCFELARGSWLLSLDADERVTPKLARDIEAALASPGDAAAFSFPRRNYVAGRPMPRGGPFHNWPDRVVRLIRKDRCACRERAVHEEMVVNGSIYPLKGALDHHAYPTYEAMRRTMDRYATLGAWRAFAEGGGEAAARAGRPWCTTWAHAGLRAAWTWFHKFVLRGGCLSGAHGFQGSAAAATYTLLKYGKLAELWERARAGESLAEPERLAMLSPGASVVSQKF